MLRALVFLGLIGLAAFGAVWLANNPETIAITWAGQEYSTSLAVGVVALTGIAIVLAIALALVRFLVTLPGTIGRHSRKRRIDKGHIALSRGLVAVAAGDTASARRHAGDAERLLRHDPLVLLLKAQSAQAAGNRDGAEAAFREMAERSDTRILGLRGLYLEARRRGDPLSAREHAQEAARIAPAIAWANDAVLEGHSADGDWMAGVRLIERRSSLGLVDKATSKRQRAVLLTADAQSRETTDPAGALQAAEQAAKLAPDLVPAAALAARLSSAQGDLKRAAKLIETAWSSMPHPELAAAYLNLRLGDSAIDRLRRAETLARLSSWSWESRLAIARAAIDARDLPRARDALRPILDDGSRPTVRLCLTVAEIESRSGNAGATREWLARAAHAPRDKAWIADGVVSEQWAPVSPVTGRIDAFVWDTPPDLLGGSTNMDHQFEPDPPSDGPAPVLLPAATDPTTPPTEPPAVETPPPEPAPETRATARPDPAPAPRPPDVIAKSATLATPTTTIASPVAPIAPDMKPAPSEIRPTPAAPAVSGASGAVVPPTPPGRQAPEPEPVVFPVRHAPDDPGPDGEADRRQRFRLKV